MTRRHHYIGIESLALNATHRAILIDAIKALGPTSGPSPARMNHWRVRLDGEAIILEAAFNPLNIDVGSFKTRLAALFGVNRDDISSRNQSHNYSGEPPDTLIITFAHNEVDRIRVALFGGPAATWDQSGNECRGYLAANREEWEPEEV